MSAIPRACPKDAFSSSDKSLKCKPGQSVAKARSVIDRQSSQQLPHF